MNKEYFTFFPRSFSFLVGRTFAGEDGLSAESIHMVFEKSSRGLSVIQFKSVTFEMIKSN